MKTGDSFQSQALHPLADLRHARAVSHFAAQQQALAYVPTG